MDTSRTRGMDGYKIIFIRGNFLYVYVNLILVLNITKIFGYKNYIYNVYFNIYLINFIIYYKTSISLRLYR